MRRKTRRSRTHGGKERWQPGIRISTEGIDWGYIPIEKREQLLETIDRPLRQMYCNILDEDLAAPARWLTGLAGTNKNDFRLLIDGTFPPADSEDIFGPGNLDRCFLLLSEAVIAKSQEHKLVLVEKASLPVDNVPRACEHAHEDAIETARKELVKFLATDLHKSNAEAVSLANIIVPVFAEMLQLIAEKLKGKTRYMHGINTVSGTEIKVPLPQSAAEVLDLDEDHADALKSLMEMAATEQHASPKTERDGEYTFKLEFKPGLFKGKEKGSGVEIEFPLPPFLVLRTDGHIEAPGLTEQQAEVLLASKGRAVRERLYSEFERTFAEPGRILLTAAKESPEEARKHAAAIRQRFDKWSDDEIFFSEYLPECQRIIGEEHQRCCEDFRKRFMDDEATPIRTIQRSLIAAEAKSIRSRCISGLASALSREYGRNSDDALRIASLAVDSFFGAISTVVRMQEAGE